MNILIGLVAIALIGATVLVLFGKYVERSWNRIDEVPPRKEEIRYYTPEEIAKFNEVFDNIRQERDKTSRELNNPKK
jgi:hypothetical protein